MYDRFGWDGVRRSGFSGFGNVDISDIFSHLGDIFGGGGGGFGDVLGDFFSFGGNEF